MSKSDFKVKKVKAQQISPGDLRARNTLKAPDTVHPETLSTTTKGQKILCTLPPHSAAALTMD